MSVIIGRLATMLSLAMTLVSTVTAQPQEPPLRVATFVLPPFVMEQGAR